MRQTTKHITLEIILTVIILLGGFAIRMVDFTNPPLDLHGFRQLRSLSIARKFFYAASPAVDADQKAQANYLGSTFEVLEPPILEHLMSTADLLAGRELPWVGRAFSIVFWMAGGVFLYLLARRMTNGFGAVLALLYYCFLPYGVQESRTVMPNPLMTAAIVAAWWAVERWVRELNWKWTLIAGVLSAFAILVKVFAAIHILLPAAFLLLGSHKFKTILKNPRPYVFVLLATLPGLLYYVLAPERGAGNYLQTWTLPYVHLLTDPYFYLRWLHLLNGYFVLVFVLLGLACLPLFGKKEQYFMVGAWFSYFLFGALLPSLISTHTYYSLPLVPIVALALAGAGGLLQQVWQAQRWSKVLIAVVLLMGLAYNGVLIRKQLTVQDYRSEPAYWAELAHALPTDGSMVGLSEDYNMRMQYYGWRFVAYYPYSYDLDMGVLAGGSYDSQAADWTHFYRYTQGYDYFLVTEMTQLEEQPALAQLLNENFPLVYETDRALLFDLRHPLGEIPSP